MATHFTWDPVEDNIIQERDDTGAITAEYATEPYLYGNLISQNRGGVERQYHFDSQGSTVALTDDNQQVTDTYTYTAFGEVTEHTGNTVNPFQYVGQKQYYLDEATGKCIARWRSLSVQQGIWLSVDPSLIVIPLDAYRYVENNPIRLIDPSGLESCEGGQGAVLSEEQKAKCCKASLTWSPAFNSKLFVHFCIEFDIPTDVIDDKGNKHKECRTWSTELLMAKSRPAKSKISSGQLLLVPRKKLWEIYVHEGPCRSKEPGGGEKGRMEIPPRKDKPSTTCDLVSCIFDQAHTVGKNAEGVDYHGVRNSNSYVYEVLKACSAIPDLPKDQDWNTIAPGWKRVFTTGIGEFGLGVKLDNTEKSRKRNEQRE